MDCQTLSLENTASEFLVCIFGVPRLDSEVLNVFPEILAPIPRMAKIVEELGELECLALVFQ